jgi:hypothetical protein
MSVSTMMVVPGRKRARPTMRAEVLLLAEQFWHRLGGPYPIPRDIERAAMLAYPVAVVKLPRLTVEVITSWLRARGAPVTVPLCDGEMSGCVVAHRGCAVIFVAGTDPTDEQRATIAHELAHFIRHYLGLRERAVRALGHRILEVLDGDRLPTFAERARSVLRDVPVGVHVHMLARDDRRGVIARVEREADELALELVAPHDVAADYLGGANASGGSARERRRALARYFGLPSQWFAPYAPDQPRQPSDRIGALLTQLRRNQ